MTHDTRGAVARRSAGVAALAAALSLCVAANALAGGFGSTTVLRTAPAGRSLLAGDLATNGHKLVVGWEESGPGGPATFLRWSTDGGASFDPKVRLDDRDNREIQVDVCGGEAWAVSTLHTPDAPAGEWLAVLDGRDLDGTGYEAGLLTLDGVARYPDIACVGNKRLAIVWYEKVGTSYHVKFFSRAIHEDAKGDNPPVYMTDLGVGSVGRGLAIAATGERIVVAWFDGDDLKVKPYIVQGGPDFTILPYITLTIATVSYGQTPELGVSGNRVVLAYTREADLVVRTSTNGGVDWGSSIKLKDVPFPSEVAAFPTNVDLRKKHVLVSGAWIGDAGGSLVGEGFTKESTNGGGAWSSVAGATHDGGRSLAALVTRTGGEVVIADAWDRWIDMPLIQKLRFHRQ